MNKKFYNVSSVRLMRFLYSLGFQKEKGIKYYSIDDYLTDANLMIEEWAIIGMQIH